MANLQRTALSTVLLVFLACFACLYTGGRRGTLPRAVQGCRSLMAGPRGGLPHCAVCAARPCLAGVQHLRGLLRAGARALGHGGMNARSVPARGTALAGHRFLWHWPRPAARRACRGLLSEVPGVAGLGACARRRCWQPAARACSRAADGLAFNPCRLLCRRLSPRGALTACAWPRRLWSTTRELHYLVRPPLPACSCCACPLLRARLHAISCAGAAASCAVDNPCAAQERELRRASLSRRGGSDSFPYMDDGANASPGCARSAGSAAPAALRCK